MLLAFDVVERRPAGLGRDPEPLAVEQLERTRELLHECRSVAEQLTAVTGKESEADAAERIAYGVLVATLEEGLVAALQHAMDVRASAYVKCEAAAPSRARRTSKDLPLAAPALVQPPRHQRLRVAAERLARALRQDGAGPHHVDIVGDLERALDVLVD